jgi:rhomboid protease GluP
LEEAQVTRSVIALNVAVFTLQLAITHGASLTHLPTREALAFGASYTLGTIGENRWETLLTACFLHDGLIHIGFNMLALWQAGPLVERAVGSSRMAPLYLTAGAAGNALSVACAWLGRTSEVVVGASGAISGVIAAAMVLGWRIQGARGPLTLSMARWLGLILVFGLVSSRTGGNVANTAHIGGALAGAAIALTWRRGYRSSPRRRAQTMVACFAVLAACIAVVAVRDRVDPFAALDLRERSEFTWDALAQGRCADAERGLLAVERLRAKMAPVTSLRSQVDGRCRQTLGQ